MMMTCGDGSGDDNDGSDDDSDDASNILLKQMTTKSQSYKL